MALTITATTPLTDDDRRMLSLLLGTAPAPQVAAAPIPPAPSVAASPAPSVASETEQDAGAPGTGEGLDADGLPWDDQIHSSNRKQNADGRWQRRRGVQDSVYDARVAVLRTLMSEDAADGVTVGEVMAGQTTAEQVFAAQVATAAEALVPTPPVPTPPAPPVPAAGDWDGQPGFLRVMKLITAKKLPAERLNALLVDVGLAPTTTSLLKADGGTREMFAALLEGAE